MFTTSQLATFNKGQLREACREKGIGYTSLNNDGMRAALAEHATDFVASTATTDTAAPQAEVAPEAPVAEVAAEVAPPAPVPPAPPSEFGPESTPAPKAPKAPKVSQPEQNGVKRPKTGTICAQIWAWCDEQDAAGVRPEAKVLRAALPALDDTTKTVQFYRWRKFNGIQGR